MERIILEIAGPAIIGGASFGISNFFNISNIDKKFSKDINTVYFCAIPVLVYVIFRLYFLALFHLLSVGKFSESRPRICKFFTLQVIDCVFPTIPASGTDDFNNKMRFTS